jgi:hypothetical protein
LSLLPPAPQSIKTNLSAYKDPCFASARTFIMQQDTCRRRNKKTVTPNVEELGGLFEEFIKVDVKGIYLLWP